MVKFLRLLSVFVLFLSMSTHLLSQISILDPTSGQPTTAYSLPAICGGGSVEHCISVSGPGAPFTIVSTSGSIGGSIIIAPPNNPQPNCFRYTAPFNFAGNNTITFTVANSSGQTAQVAISILIVDRNTPINGGPEQHLCSGSSNTTTLTAINPDPLVSGYWTVFSGTGVIGGGFDSPYVPGVDQRGGPTVTVTNLSLGQNLFIWTQVYPCQQKTSIVTVNLYNGNPPVADANICYPNPQDHSAKSIDLCDGVTSFSLCGNSPGVAAIGTWGVIGGSGTILNTHLATNTVVALGVGCNKLEWSISNGTCPGGDTRDTLTLCTYPTIQQADAGADIVRCLSGPSLATILSGNKPYADYTGLWTFVSGPTTPNIVSPTTEVTNITGLTQPGIYTFHWTITSGPCGSHTDEVKVFLHSPNSIVNAGEDQNICLPNNSTTLAAVTPISPAVGTWTVIAGTGSFANPTSPTSSVSGLSSGVNTFRWTVNNGPCPNNALFDEVTINVYPAAQPTANAGSDQTISYSGSPISTSLSGNNPLPPGVGTWTVTGPTIPVFLPNNHAPNATLSGLQPGTYTLTWTIENGSCSAPQSDQMQIFIHDCNNNSIDAGNTQAICSPNHSVTMNAQPAPTPAVGTWTIIQGGGSISSANSATTVVNNIPIGVNIFRWTINNGTCGSFYDEVIINVHDNAATVAEAGLSQEFCMTSSGVEVFMNATPVNEPASGNWSGPGTISSAQSPHATVSNLPIGLHTFTWTVNNGACGSDSDQMIVEIFSPSQTQANAGADQQLCSINNSTSLVGNSLIVPATGTWSIVSGGGNIVSPNSQATAVNNIPIGHNVFKWTIDNGPCGFPAVTEDFVSIDVFNSNLASANAGADQNVCSSSPTVTLGGNIVSVPAVGTWSVTPTGPTFNNINLPNAVVSNLTPGTIYTFVWTIDNGTCGTSSDAMVLNYYNVSQQPANAGVDSEICWPGSTSFQLNGNVPDSPATGTWTFISGPNTPIYAANQYNSTLAGLIPGTYVMRWTINNGACAQAITFDEVSVQVFSSSQTLANAGSDQQICLPVDFTTLTGNALIPPATGTWMQVSGPALATINNPNLRQVDITGLEVGCYVFRWTVNNGGCDGGTSMDEVSVCVFDNTQSIAAAGPDQNLCSPISSTVLAGNSVISPAMGTWTVVSGPSIPSFSPNINANDAILGNLVVGTYVLKWSVNNGNCNNANTSDEVVIKIYDSSQQSASINPVSDLCSPDDTVVMDANAVISPAVGTWTLISGMGAIDQIHNPQSMITNIPVGVNCFRWTVDNGSCGTSTSFDEVCVNVFSINQQTANAGLDQDICTPNSSVIMAGNNVITPAIGVWTQISGPAVANIVSPNQRNTEINNLEIGCYEFSWSISNGVCTNSSSSDIVEICIFPGGFPEANAGVDQEICSPSSSVVMTADAAISPGEGTWTLVSGPNNPSFDVHDPETPVTGLVPGVYVFNWSLNYSSCGSEWDDVTITVFDSNQSQSVAGADQSFCTPVSTTNLSADAVLPPGYGTWSIASGEVDFVDIHNPSTSIYNIPAGTHVLVWTVYNGSCLSSELTTDTVVVTIHDSAQQPATAGLDRFICTPQSSVIVNGTPLLSPATGLWTTTSNATIESPNTASSTMSNLEVGVSTFCYTVDNGVCSPPSTSDCMDVYVYDNEQEEANAGVDQSLCAVDFTCATLNGNSVIYPAIGTWTQIDGLTNATFGDIHQNNTSVCNLIPGVYVFQWCIDNGPCATITCSQVTITVYPNDTPQASVGEDVELCSTQNSVSMNASIANPPASGQWELVSGTGTIQDIDNPHTLISNLAIGENIFSWCVSNGTCENSGTCDTLSIFVFDQDAQEANAGDDQDLCKSTDLIFLTATAVSNPGEGTWTAIGNYASSIVDIHNAHTELVGLDVGEYFFVWSVYNGPCSNTNTTDTVRIRIYDNMQSAVDAGENQSICTPTTMVTMDANAVTFPGVGYWEAVPGGSGTIQSTGSPVTQVTGLTPGISDFVWTVLNGPCLQESSDTVTIYIYDTNIPPAHAGENQNFCAPADLSPLSTTLDGSIIEGAATGLWTQVSGPSIADIETPEENTTNISGLLVGEYIFKWTVLNGPCGESDSNISIIINDPNLPAAEAGEDIDYCTPLDEHPLSATPVAFPAFGTWTAFPPVPITDINNPSAIASNIEVGYQTFIWTVNNGICGSSSDLQTVRVYDEFQPAANAGVDIELCNLTEVNLDASDFYDPAIGTWSLFSGCSDVVITDVNNQNALIVGLCVGTQCFQWTVFNGPCPNSNTEDVVCVQVYNPDIVVEASEDQSICTPENTVTVFGTDPEDPNVGEWVVVAGGGTILNANSATTDITDLPVGINTFHWQFYNGDCDNQPFDDVTINVYDSSHPWANAGDDIEMCEPENTAILTANLPIVPAIGYWTLISGMGTISDASSPEITVTDLEVGDNVFVWTIENGPCDNSIMTDTVVVHVFPQNPQSALGGPNQSICTPDNSVTLEATQPDAPSTGVWEVVALDGLIADIYNPNTTVDFLAVGTHTLRWVIDNGPCNDDNSDTVIIRVYDDYAPEAEVESNIELCWPDIATEINANSPLSPATGRWSILSAPGAPVIADSLAFHTSISGLEIGITELLWELDNGTCGTTSDTLKITVFSPESPNSSVVEDQLICDVPQCVDLQGSAPLAPAYGWWEQIAGDNITDITDSSSFTTTACNLALNETAFVWHVYNGACNNSLTTDTLWFYIYDAQIASADAGEDAFYCDPDMVNHQLVGSGITGTIQGLATGQWTGDLGDIVNPTSSYTMVNNLPAGVHCFTWTVDNGACGTTADEVCITIYDQNQPNANAGMDEEICSNEFLAFYLHGNEPLIPATGYWTILDGPVEIQNEDSPDAYVTSLGSILTELVDVPSMLIWTIDNGICGTSSDTVAYVLKDCETLKIPNAISPNGDGVNDEFIIPNLEYYPNNRLQIYNRWGALVYEKAPYKNDWDGRSNHSSAVGDQLPVATYYYVLSLGESYDGDPEKVFTGYIYLKR